METKNIFCATKNSIPRAHNKTRAKKKKNVLTGNYFQRKRISFQFNVIPLEFRASSFTVNNTLFVRICSNWFRLRMSVLMNKKNRKSLEAMNFVSLKLLRSFFCFLVFRFLFSKHSLKLSHSLLPNAYKSDNLFALIAKTLMNPNNVMQWFLNIYLAILFCAVFRYRSSLCISFFFLSFRRSLGHNFNFNNVVAKAKPFRFAKQKEKR